MDEQSLRNALKDLPMGGLRYFEQTGSTNDDAAAWLREGARHFSLVTAGAQTAGRGRSGRTWQSPAGTSLSMSLVLRPQDAQPASLPRFTALGTLAVCRALEKLYGLDVQIKWPNDVLLKRKKAAGVLAEAVWMGDQLDGVILGIGINVAPQSVETAAQREKSLRFPATSVEEVLGRAVDPLELLRAVVTEVVHGQSQMASPGYLAEWEARLAFRDETVQIISEVAGAAAGPIQEGRIVGLQEDGSLELQTANQKIVRVHAGEIRLRPVEVDR